MPIDALAARAQGRDPVLAGDLGPWRVEVFRVGRYHEYQAVASRAGFLLQTGRVAGPGAMRMAYASAEYMAYAHDRTRLPPELAAGGGGADGR